MDNLEKPGPGLFKQCHKTHNSRIRRNSASDLGIRMTSKTKQDSRVSLEDLIAASHRVAAVIESVRGTMLAPDARKNPPTFTSNQIAAVCGLQ